MLDISMSMDYFGLIRMSIMNSKEPIKQSDIKHKGAFHVRIPKDVTAKLLAEAASEFRSAPVQISKIVCDYFERQKNRK